MVLTADVSNGMIRFGIFENGSLRTVFRMAADLNRTSDEYAASIVSILSLKDIDAGALKSGIICSVVPPLTHVIENALSQLLGSAPMTVGPGIKTGLNIRIENPAQLGSDLVATAVGALARYSAPLVLISCGLVTTVSVLDEGGAFLGTVIAPGPGIFQSSLSACAANLPDVSLEAPRTLVGKNTVDSMQSGVVHGTAAMIDGLIDRICAQQGFSGDFQAVVTGEFAELIAPYCTHNPAADSNLLLDGLYLLYQKNTHCTR